MKVSYNWLKEYVGDALPNAQETADLLTHHAFEIDEVEEVDGDVLIDIDVLPNRASDCLCHRGVARELATILDTDLTQDPLDSTPELTETDKISITIEDPSDTPRFTASLITGVTVGESPDWLKERLEGLGHKSINNIVDATNYVMLAIGQPLHAYDADKLQQKDGVCEFVVRRATEGETVSLLAEGGGNEDRVVELQGNELLIVDGESGVAMGLAGIKGGRYAEVTADTKNIIVEAAHFDPIVVRKTARRLGIVIDSSKRFENEPARDLPAYAQAEITKLILDIAGGEHLGVADQYPSPSDPNPVTVRLKKVNQLLGLGLSLAEVAALIKRTGATVTEGGDDTLIATAPFERTDLHIEADYIEEVARINGLDKVQSVVPESVALSEINPLQYYSERIRTALVNAGLSEVITSSFHKKGKIQLQNALASDKSYVRGSLTKTIHQVLDANFSHTDLLGISDIRVFEIGTVFTKMEVGIAEHVSLAIGVRTKGNGYNQKDDAALSAVLDIVHTALDIELDFKIEKGVAEINLSEVIERLPAPTAYEPVPPAANITYQSVSPYPAMARDIALWVGESESADMVLEILNAEVGDLCVRRDLFDTFSKDGRTSYAFRFVFQANDRTLTDDEVNNIMDNVYKKAEKQGWEVR